MTAAHCDFKGGLDFNIHCLESVDSTNSWLAAHEADLPSPLMVYSRSQTAGRGQRGNSWESEPYKNITASVIFHPEDFEACNQFRISEAVAMAICDYLEEKGVDAKVKWPNDIYVGDRKICGILVEHTVIGRNISRTIVGFGINLNQEKFLSDAPNPVSLTMLTGCQYDVDREVEILGRHLFKNIQRLKDEDFHQKFLSNLWRHDGKWHEFYDRNSGENIKGRIVTVAPTGMLKLETADGEMREYAFKEIEFKLG